jgi:phosphatidylserine decarboxylase
MPFYIYIFFELETLKNLQTNVYKSLPLRMMSRGWGWLAERQVPESLRPSIFGLYSSAFGVNLEEAVVSDLK